MLSTKQRNRKFPSYGQLYTGDILWIFEYDFWLFIKFHFTYIYDLSIYLTYILICFLYLYLVYVKYAMKYMYIWFPIMNVKFLIRINSRVDLALHACLYLQAATWIPNMIDYIDIC